MRYRQLDNGEYAQILSGHWRQLGRQLSHGVSSSLTRVRLGRTEREASSVFTAGGSSDGLTARKGPVDMVLIGGIGGVLEIGQEPRMPPPWPRAR